MRIGVLRAFIKVLETESFTTAAEQLYITQSTLSKQIKKLEKMAGRKLLERTTRSVKATTCGLVFKVHVLRILQEWDLLIERMGSIQDCAKPRICIGYTTSEQLSFILAGLNCREWDRKGTEIKLCREDAGKIVDAIKNGSIDCAVMHRPTLYPDTGMQADCLAKSKIHAFISDKSPLSKRKTLKLSDVCKETDVRCLHSRDPRYYNAIDACFSDAGLRLPKRVEADESEELEILASRNLYMSLCPSIYPAWKGFLSIPVIDCDADFDFLFVRNSSNMNPELDHLFMTIHRAMQAYL